MLEYNQDQAPATPAPIVAPVTTNTVNVEQVTAYQPKRKWWLVILLSVIGVLIIGSGVYAFLFTDLKYKLPFLNKPVEVSKEVVNSEPVVENIVATSTIDENLDTDDDGLRDADEINIWKTDINNTDSDGDSYLDGDEVNNGYNPVGDGRLAIHSVENENLFILSSKDQVCVRPDFSPNGFGDVNDPDLELEVALWGTFTMGAGYAKSTVNDVYQELVGSYGGNSGDPTWNLLDNFFSTTSSPEILHRNGLIFKLLDNQPAPNIYAFSFLVAEPNSRNVCDFKDNQFSTLSGHIVIGQEVCFYGAACWQVNNDDQNMTIAPVRGEGQSWDLNFFKM